MFFFFIRNFYFFHERFFVAAIFVVASSLCYERIDVCREKCTCWYICVYLYIPEYILSKFTMFGVKLFKLFYSPIEVVLAKFLRSYRLTGSQFFFCLDFSFFSFCFFRVYEDERRRGRGEAADLRIRVGWGGEKSKKLCSFVLRYSFVDFCYSSCGGFELVSIR